MEETRLVCVRRCYGLDVGQIYKSKLQAAGFPVMLQYDSIGPVMGITVDGLGEVRVMVPEPFAAEAEALLADLSDDELPDFDVDDLPLAPEDEPSEP
jgi:hypothetical protein